MKTAMSSAVHASPAIEGGTPTTEHAPRAAAQRQPVEVCHSPDAQLTDETREQAIVRAGEAVEKHMAQGNRQNADEARRLMESLIAGRSPEQVARMEAERGLS